jgi:hypothetical protein
MSFLNKVIYFFPYHISFSMVFILLLFTFLLLLFKFLPKKVLKKIEKNKFVSFLLIFLSLGVGLYARLSLAYFTKGNYDIDSFKLVASILEKGANVYAETKRYNYSPLWFYILFLLKQMNSFLPFVSFNFIIRVWGSLVDLISLFVLYKFSKMKKLYFPLVCIGFFLNPVSIVLTGHHGQFENLVVLLILVGAYFYKKNKKPNGLTKLKNNIRNKAGFLFFLLAGVLKHIAFNQILVFLNHKFKKKSKVVLYFLLSVFVFFLLFVPFLRQGREGILENVFLYKSRAGYYGVTSFLGKVGLEGFWQEVYGFVFIVLLFLFSFVYKSKSLVKSILVNFLFFLSFTPGMADQYLVLPLAFASLDFGLFYIIYSVVAGFYLFKSPAQLVIKKYGFFSDNLLWFVIIAWFFVKILTKDEKKA